MRLIHQVAQRFRGSTSPPPPPPAGGKLVIWGGYQNSTLGNSGGGEVHMIPTPVPVMEMGLVDVVDAVVAISQTFVLHSDQTVSVWGDGTFGTLGMGEQRSLYNPTPMTTLSTSSSLSAPDPPMPAVVRALTGAGAAGGALLEDGTTRAWGAWPSCAFNPAEGSVGGGGMNKYRPLRQEHPPIAGVRQFVTGVVEFRIGFKGSMVRKGDGSMWRAGDKRGHPTNLYMEAEHPFDVLKNGTPQEIVEFRTEFENTLVRLADGTVRIIGGNRYGQLGTGFTEDEETAPIWKATTGSPPKAVKYKKGALVRESAGSGTVYEALVENAELKPSENPATWSVRATTVPDRTIAEVLALLNPVAMPENPGTGKPYKVIGIALAEYVPYCLLENGQIVAWGRNHRGQCGNGTVVAQVHGNPVRSIDAVMSPSFVLKSAGVRLSSVVEVQGCAPSDGGGEVGAAHAAARDEGGNVWAWGGNSEYALGDGSKDDFDLKADSNKPFATFIHVTHATAIRLAEGFGIALVSAGVEPAKPVIEAVPNVGDRGMQVKFTPHPGDTVSFWELQCNRKENIPLLHVMAKITHGSNVIDITTPPEASEGGPTAIYAGMPIGGSPYLKKSPKLVRKIEGSRWETNVKASDPIVVNGVTVTEVTEELNLGGGNEPGKNLVKVPYKLDAGSDTYVWRGPWLSSSSYVAGDAVMRNGNNFLSLAGANTTDPLSSGTWRPLKIEQTVELTDAFMDGLLYPLKAYEESTGEHGDGGLPWRNASSLMEIRVVEKPPTAPTPELWLNAIAVVQPNHVPLEVPVLAHEPWLTQEPVHTGDVLSVQRDAQWTVNSVPVPASTLTIRRQWYHRRGEALKESEETTEPLYEPVEGVDVLATGPTYKVQPRDIGSQIRVAEYASNAAGETNLFPHKKNVPGLSGGTRFIAT